MQFIPSSEEIIEAQVATLIEAIQTLRPDCYVEINAKSPATVPSKSDLGLLAHRWLNAGPKSSQRAPVLSGSGERAAAAKRVKFYSRGQVIKDRDKDPPVIASHPIFQTRQIMPIHSRMDALVMPASA